MNLVRIGLQLWIFLFLGFFGSELLAAEPGLRIATQVLFGLPLVVWALFRLRGPRGALDWAIAASLIALSIASVLSADPQGSLDAVGLALAFAVLFWAMRDLGQTVALRRAIAVAGAYAFMPWLVLAAAFWIAEKVSWVQAAGGIPNVESNQVFIWGTANAFPIISLLTVGFLIALPGGRPRRALWVTWAIASAVVVPLSAGRAGWLGFVVAALTFEAVEGFPRWRAIAAWLRARRLFVPVLATVTVGGVGLLTLVLARGMTSIVDDISIRARIWNEGIAMLAGDPLTGGGPTTFSWLRLTHVPDYGYAVPVRLAHNVVVQTLADGGILLGSAFGALLVTFALTAWRGRARLGREGRAWAAILLGYGAAALLDDFSSLPAVIAAVIIIAAWVAASARDANESVGPGRVGSVALPLLIAALALLIGPSAFGMETARLAAADGRRAALDARWTDAQQAFHEAVERYPANAGYHMSLGLALARRNMADAARAEYRVARDLSPGDPRPWGALAALAEDPAERVRLLDEASRRTITDPQYAFRLGDAIGPEGETAKRVDAYALATVIDSSRFVALDSELRSAVAARVPSLVHQLRQVAPIQLETVRWDLGLAQGSLPGDAGPAWRAVAAAMAGDSAAARAALREARAASPYASRTLLAAAAVSRADCDRRGYDAARLLLGPYRPPRTTELAATRDYAYRDQGLGTYQPMAEPPYSPPAEWPWSLVGEPPACAGW